MIKMCRMYISLNIEEIVVTPLTPFDVNILVLYRFKLFYNRLINFFSMISIIQL